MSRRTFVIIAALIVSGILASIAVTSVSILNRTTIAHRYKLPSSLTAAITSGENTVTTTNGYSLISYNYVTGDVKSLSPKDSVKGLGNIFALSVSGDGQYITFNTLSTKPGSLLANILSKKGLEISRGYWWFYDVKAQTFTPLDKQVAYAKIIDNHLYALTGKTGERSLQTFDFALRQTATIPIARANNFTVDGDTYYLQSGREVLATKDGITNTTISADINPVTSKGSTLIGVNKKSQLVSVDLRSGVTKIIDTNKVAGLAVGVNGLVLYRTGDKKTALYVYDLTTNKHTRWYISKDAGGEDGVGDLVALLDKKTAIITDNNRNYYLIGTSLKPVDESNPLLNPKD